MKPIGPLFGYALAMIVVGTGDLLFGHGNAMAHIITGVAIAVIDIISRLKTGEP